MPDYYLIPQAEFSRVRRECPDDLHLVADMCRANTLMTIKRAGSGHMGSSFSSMDIAVFLYYEYLNTVRLGMNHEDRDIYYSSKGHDVPAQYAILHSLGYIEPRTFINLRRQGGTPGHPDVLTPGIEANTGSLGMGISKAKGFAWYKRHFKRGGQVVVLTGDGELQEGQNYEAFQTAVAQGLTNLIVVVDANEVQSDKFCRSICDLGDIKAKLVSFGWHVAECDGHDYVALRRQFRELSEVTDRPKFLLARTIKGRGISFMEHPTCMTTEDSVYMWHSGAPDDAAFERAYQELIDGINQRLRAQGFVSLTLDKVEPPPPPVRNTAEMVIEAYGDTVARLVSDCPKLVILDADLAADCRVRRIEEQMAPQFIEDGIAEQDMVSMAGGLALAGMVPIVNSFAAFLAARANEQIYANNTEKTKIMYACNYGGVLPAGPGHSHQSVRDIALLSSMPDLLVFQPCNALETELGVEYLVRTHPGSSAIRLYLGASPAKIDLPQDYSIRVGCGAVLRPGKDLWLVAYGPVLVSEALRAAELLVGRGLSAGVINLPWLNRVDVEWLDVALAGVEHVFVLEDHCPTGGLAATVLLAAHRSGKLLRTRVHQFAVEGIPECGTAQEVLRYHHLDAESLVEAACQRVSLKVEAGG